MCPQLLITETLRRVYIFTFMQIFCHKLNQVIANLFKQGFNIFRDLLIFLLLIAQNV